MATGAKKEEMNDDVDDNIVDPLDDDDQDFADELKPGTKLLQGQYTIERFLNSGGFGITYLAKDSLDRRVVIKECFPGSFCRRSNTIVGARSRAHQNEFKSIVRLFVQEAKSLSKLDHPNIVGVHQVFEDNDTAYMAIDYIEGRDLLEIIEDEEEEALDVPRITAMLEKILHAVGFIHDSGVLHRDISPDNILMDAKGEPILIDFGAAREQATKASRALSALRVVKDGYSPQEFYIAGSTQSNSSDLYALAASFHHVIAGDTPPNSQARLAAIAADDADPYEPLAGKYEGYPPGFLEAIDKALNVLPKDRIQNATDWLAEINQKAKEEAAMKAAANDVRTDEVVAQIVAQGDGDEKKVSPTKPQRVAAKSAKPIKKIGLKESASKSAEAQLDGIRNVDPEPEKKGKGVVILLGTVAALALIGGGAYFALNSGAGDSAGPGDQATISAPGTGESAPTTPQAGGTEATGSETNGAETPSVPGDTDQATTTLEVPGNNKLSDPVALSKALAELEGQKASAAAAAREAERQQLRAEIEAQTAAEAAERAKAEAEAIAAAEARALEEAAARQAKADADAQAAAEALRAVEERLAKEAQAREEAEARLATESRAREVAEAEKAEAAEQARKAAEEREKAQQEAETAKAEAEAAAEARRAAEEKARTEAQAKNEAEAAAKAAAAAQAAAEKRAAEQAEAAALARRDEELAAKRAEELAAERAAEAAAEAAAEQQKAETEAARLEREQKAEEEAEAARRAAENASAIEPAATSRYVSAAEWSYSIPFSARPTGDGQALLVDDVFINSGSGDAVLAAGDVIRAVDGNPVASFEDFQAILKQATGVETVGGVISQLTLVKGIDGSETTQTIAVPAQRRVTLVSGHVFDIRLTGDGWQPVVVESSDTSQNGLKVGDVIYSNFATQTPLQTPTALEDLLVEVEKTDRAFVDFAVLRKGELTLAILQVK